MFRDCRSRVVARRPLRHGSSRHPFRDPRPSSRPPPSTRSARRHSPTASSRATPSSASKPPRGCALPRGGAPRRAPERPRGSPPPRIPRLEHDLAPSDPSPRPRGVPCPRPESPRLRQIRETRGCRRVRPGARRGRSRRAVRRARRRRPSRCRRPRLGRRRVLRLRRQARLPDAHARRAQRRPPHGVPRSRLLGPRAVFEELLRGILSDSPRRRRRLSRSPITPSFDSYFESTPRRRCRGTRRMRWWRRARNPGRCARRSTITEPRVRRKICGATWGPVTRPAQVQWGSRDRYLQPELAEPPESLATRGAQVVRHPNATHWVHWDEPEAVANALSRSSRRMRSAKYGPFVNNNPPAGRAIR